MRSPSWIASVLVHVLVVLLAAMLVATPADAGWRPSPASLTARVEFGEPGPSTAEPPAPPEVEREVPRSEVGPSVAAWLPFPVPEESQLPQERALPRRVPDVWMASLRPVPEPPAAASAPPGEGREPSATATAAAASADAPDAAYVAAIPDAARNAPPQYPTEARQSGAEGTVRLALDIDANGEVTAARVVVSSGHRSLDRAALRALRTWKFSPARRGSLAVASSLERDVVFALVDART